MIKDVFRFVLPLSAVIPATILLLFCFLILGKCLSGPGFYMTDIGYILSSLLGILGYLGLFRLFMVGDNERNKVTRLLLLAGILSFVLFTSLSGTFAWKWVLTFQEPDEWFLMVWPTVVSIFYTIRLGAKSFH